MAAAPRSWTWACECCVGRRRRKGGAGAGAGASPPAEEGDEWSLFMDLPVLEAATDGFSDGNLLGRGGFGPVYKAINPPRFNFLSAHALQYSVITGFSTGL